jgi:hypothetical protein
MHILVVLTSFAWELSMKQCYTARNLTGLSQAVDFTGLRQVVNKSRQVCWFRQAVTGLREQVCRKLLKTEP